MLALVILVAPSNFYSLREFYFLECCMSTVCENMQHYDIKQIIRLFKDMESLKYHICTIYVISVCILNVSHDTDAYFLIFQVQLLR